MTVLLGPAPEIARDNYGRPLVVPPSGGKAVPYIRATTFANTLEDTFNLDRWMQRMVALGLADRPDLLLSVVAHRDNKKQLDKICTDAREFAKAGAAATTGTALHVLCEQIDRGLDVGVIPDAYQADLAAYQEATAGLTATHIEQFTVVDDLRIGGTPDRVVRLADGRTVIADIKTGSIEWGIGKIAIQLALYSRGVVYQRGIREPLGPVDPDVAIVIHLPAGKGTCELVEVDIGAGWEAVQVAQQVRAWRKRKDLARPFTVGFPAIDTIAEAVEAATSVDQLYNLFESYGNRWTDTHTSLAAARKTALTQEGATA